MRISRRNLMLAAVARAMAQDAPTFTTSARIVTLLATVHDRDGRAINNLEQNDFALAEDGVPQTIRYFSKESDLPLSIGLLVDTSRSQEGVLDRERSASRIFFEKILREDMDHAFVSHFDERVELLQGLTSSRADLAAALNRLSIPGRYATLIYSAVRDSSETVMKKQPGRKALILLTDGVAFRDPVSIGTAIEFAQRADTILYSIRFADRIAAYRPIRAAVLGVESQKGKQGLERMAKETGGVMYEVSKTRTIEDIYAQIEAALRSQYSIGYTPVRPGGDGKYRRIRLTTRDTHLIVNTRDGYYAQ